MSDRKSRTALGFSLLTVLLAVGAANPPNPGEELAERARRIHRDAIVIDTHLDAPMNIRQEWTDLGLRGATPHFDIPRAKEGGLTASFFAIYVPVEFAETGGAIKEGLELIDLVNQAVAGDLRRRHPRCQEKRQGGCLEGPRRRTFH
jgi:membrane dipeptidase